MPRNHSPKTSFPATLIKASAPKRKPKATLAIWSHSQTNVRSISQELPKPMSNTSPQHLTPILNESAESVTITPFPLGQPSHGYSTGLRPLHRLHHHRQACRLNSRANRRRPHLARFDPAQLPGPNRAPKLLEIGTLILFGALTLYTLLAKPSWSVIGVRLCVDTGLLLIVLISIAIRRPFTLQYAKEKIAPKFWNTPQFIRTNYIISAPGRWLS